MIMGCSCQAIFLAVEVESVTREVCALQGFCLGCQHMVTSLPVCEMEAWMKIPKEFLKTLP